MSYPNQPLTGIHPNGQPTLTTMVRKRAGDAAMLAGGFVLSIWVVFLLGGNWVTYYGIHPLDLAALPNILFSPFIHANLTHILSNTVPGALFAFLIALSGKRAFFEVSAIVIVLGGLGVWLIGGVATNHIGASGLIYGWLAYLIMRGFFNKSLGQIVLGLVLAVSYTGWIWGVLPTTVGVSWQAHLCGAIAGVVAAAKITSD